MIPCEQEMKRIGERRARLKSSLIMSAAECKKKISKASSVMCGELVNNS